MDEEEPILHELIRGKVRYDLLFNWVEEKLLTRVGAYHAIQLELDLGGEDED